MKHLDFFFDVISPYAYLAFERLPQALEGLSVEVAYRPVLFAGLLGHWGQKGPAEIVPKRAFTYRQAAWLAHRDGVPFGMPATHPFNPLALLRLAWACAADGTTPNRRACEAVLRHVWAAGGDPVDAGRLAALEAELAPVQDPRGEPVKARLREATEQAVAQGVFGVPTIVADGRTFWGYDTLDMLAAALRGDPWFDGPGWHETAAVPVGAERRH